MTKAMRIFLGWSLFACASFSFAGIHPVPLDKNTDTAKCAECHEDKAKGKFVHSAIATGCTSCHEVRVNKDVTRIKLITATPSARCESPGLVRSAPAPAPHLPPDDLDPEPWPFTPVGDCEHEKGGLDRSRVRDALRCKRCTKDEKARAKARQLREVS